MKINANNMLKIRRTVITIIIFAVLPAFLAASFQRGCYFCVASSHHIVDYVSYSTYYLSITRDGWFRVIDAKGPCLNQSMFDTLLHAGGLKALEESGNVMVVAGNTGTIYRGLTGNYHNWARISSGTTANLNDIAISTPTSIFICGDSGTILKSTNVGVSYFSQTSGTSLRLNRINWIDSNNIRIAGDSLLTLYTTNGGLTWMQQYVTIFSGESNPPRVDLNAVYFINSNTGWLAGDDYIFKTTNQGAIWIPRYKQQQPYDNSSNSILFYNLDSGVVAGNRGDVQFTTNGGNSWFYSPELQGITTKNLNKIFYDPLSGVASIMGDSGIVIYSDPVTLGIEAENSIPREYSLMQNYPNPFNPATNISFAIPSAEFVKLAVYDLTGRELEILLNSKLEPGIHKAVWDASNYPSGVYFYKLETEAFSQTKKMILLK
jgi:photosystem II stability/assembly factor-like uncharacterized protein